MLLYTLDFSVNWLLLDHCFLMDLQNLHYWKLTLYDLFLVFKVSNPQKVVSSILGIYHHIISLGEKLLLVLCLLWLTARFINSQGLLFVGSYNISKKDMTPQSWPLLNPINSLIQLTPKSDQILNLTDHSIISAPWLNQHNTPHRWLAP